MRLPSIAELRLDMGVEEYERYTTDTGHPWLRLPPSKHPAVCADMSISVQVQSKPSALPQPWLVADSNGPGESFDNAGGSVPVIK